MGARFVLCFRFGLAWAWSLLIAGCGCLLMPFIGTRRSWLIIRVPWAKVSLWILRIRLSVRGQEHLQPGCIYISNHISLIDIVVLPALLPKETNFVAKRSLLWVPIWGWMFGLGGALLIDRKKPAEAMRRLADGARKLPPDWSIVIFPEGRRSLTGNLGRFKRGVCHLAEALGGRPIVPIGLDGAREIVPADGILIRPGEIRVSIGPAIDTSSFEPKVYHEKILTCRDAVAAQIEIAKTLPGEIV